MSEFSDFKCMYNINSIYINMYFSHVYFFPRRHVEVYTAPHQKYLFSIKSFPRMAPGTIGFNLMQVSGNSVILYFLPNFLFSFLSYLQFSSCQVLYRAQVAQ